MTFDPNDPTNRFFLAWEEAERDRERNDLNLPDDFDWRVGDRVKHQPSGIVGRVHTQLDDGRFYISTPGGSWPIDLRSQEHLEQHGWNWDGFCRESDNWLAD